MFEQSALFDLGPRLPTTRDIALLVRECGEEALTEAERRADAARYQEIQCRAALNRTVGMPFNWTLNPYRGCTHACEYCFARKYQHQLELGDHYLVVGRVVDLAHHEDPHTPLVFYKGALGGFLAAD